MPVNHTAKLIEQYGHKVIPAAHPIDPRMYEFFIKQGLYNAYLADDTETIQDAFKCEETGIAGFMGNRSPTRTRWHVAGTAPSWADFRWARAKSPLEYIKWMMCRRGCIDMRGNGDKSLRFTEAAMLGRTILAQPWPSQYSPALVDGHNCIMVDTWDKLDGRYDDDLWRKISKQSTYDYCNGWSIRSQVRSFLAKAKSFTSKES